MWERIGRITVVLPVIAMAAACIPFVRGLFYDFRNDTVPLFSIFISSALSAVGIILTGTVVLCAIGFYLLQTKRLRLLAAGVMLLCVLVFSGLCALCYVDMTRMIAGFCIVSGLLTVLSAVCCMLSDKKNDPESR